MQLTLTADDLPLQRVYRWERERADQVFLTQPYGGGKVRQFTWEQSVAEARRVATHLKAQDWEPGSRVAILSKNCAWWILADLAIWMAGHVTVPVYPSLKPLTVRRILEHSGCRGCFCGPTDDPDVARLGIPSGVHCISLPNGLEEGEPNWDQVVRTAEPLSGNPVRPAEDLATIIYTSGTTGAPKGVMHRFGALAADALALQRLVNAVSEDRFISYLPLAHVVERCGLEMTSIREGARIFFVEGIETFVQDLKRARATIFLSVPRLLLKFQQGVYAKISRKRLEAVLRVPVIRGLIQRKVLSGLGLTSVRLAASGAAPLPVDVLSWYWKIGLPLVEGYGMTETTITHLPLPNTLRPGFVGPALDGVEMKVTADGELLVRSPMNMAGYYRDPEMTKTVLDAEGFFHTGDLVSLSDDGQVRIVGRIKDQFKTSKGKYVAPAPIESRLAEHPAVEACCLMGAGLPSPFALVLLNAETGEQAKNPELRKSLEASLELLLAQVNDELDPHERVAFVAVVEGPWSIENGIMTPTLKIRRNLIEGKYLDRVDSWRSQEKRVVWER